MSRANDRSAISTDCAGQTMDRSVACQSIDTCTILNVSITYSRFGNRSIALHKRSIAQPEQTIDHYQYISE